MNKILIFFFSVLLVIIVGEIVYYFYFIPPPQTISQVTKTQNSAQPSPTSPVQSNQPQPLKPRELLVKVEEFFKEHEKGALTSSVLINQYIGKITDIEKKKIPNEPHPKSEYSIFITIQGTNTIEKSRIKIKDLNLPQTKIIEKIGEKESSIEISDLKMDDFVIVTENYPLTKNSPDDILRYTILKVNP